MKGLFSLVLTTLVFVLSTTMVSSQSYGDYCSLDTPCDGLSGLTCISGFCGCLLSTMNYYPDRSLCLAPVGTTCYLDGSAQCIDDAQCVDNVFEGTGQCACNSGYTPVQANNCDNPQDTIGPDGTPYPLLCCPV